MQKVQLTFKTPTATMKDGKPVVVFETATATHIVASTKSFNNLLEDYQAEGKIPSQTKKEDIFLDRVKTEQAVDALVNEQVKDKDTANLIAEFVKKALDGACIYYKPIIRKK